MLRLHHYRLCPRSRSVRMLMAELKVEATLVDERPWEWSVERATLNPSGELPILIEETTGAGVAGYGPIIEYLADSSDGDLVIPGDPLARAEIRRVTTWFHDTCQHSVTDPLLDAKLYSRFRQDAGSAAPDAETLRAVRGNLRYHLRYLEHLAEHGDWLGGEIMSAADFAAAGHVSVLDYLGEIDWGDCPHARNWYARMKSRPAMRALLAERVPGAAAPPAHYADPDF